MHYIVGEIVLAPGDEDLAAGDAPIAVATRDRVTLQSTDIASRLRLREVHRRSPLAADHLREIGSLQLLRTVLFQRIDGSEPQHWTQRESQVCGVEILHHRGCQAVRKPLAAPLDRCGKTHPAALDEPGVCFAESSRRGHIAVVPARFLAVADLVKRRQLAFSELRGGLEERVHRFRTRLCEPVRFGQLRHAHDMIENEALVAYWTGEVHGRST